MNKCKLVVRLAMSVLLTILLSNSLPPVQAQDSRCPPLSPHDGSIVVVSTEAQLRYQAYNAAPGSTLVVQAGSYHMQNYIQVINDQISIRGQTGDPNDVILDFGGMQSGYFGILVSADDFTIADLTIRNATDHGVSIQGYDRPVLYNLNIQDIGDQLVKVNPHTDGIRGSDSGLLACSRLAYSSSAPDEYTNGISAHKASNWVVRDNQWYRIRGNAGYTGPTILFWSGSSDTVVERNLIVDCYRGIAFGNAGHSGLDHTGGIVRNNFIYSSLEHDVAIEMVHARGWLVANNTALLVNPSPGLTWGMEARYADSQGIFAHNLTNMNIWSDRDGANGLETGNVTNAQPGWFVEAGAGDLHLMSHAAQAIDQASSLPQVTDDYDADPRPIGSAPDVGADEYGQPPPPGVIDLQFSQDTATGGIMTARLQWTPPADAISTTIRYQYARITEGNWERTNLLADELPGSTRQFDASVPYSEGDTVFFTLKTQNAGAIWSSLSNNAFWPHQNLFLPLVLRSY